jgi:hypothetical protein
MRIDKSARVFIELFDGDIETMREILRLAYERLHQQEAVQMSGVPFARQAGLVGPELFRVKEALTALGAATGIDLPYDPPGANASLTLSNHKE